MWTDGAEVSDHTNDALDRLLGDLPGAAASYPFGPQARVHKVGGRIFAIEAPDASPRTITIKCDPFEAEGLRRAYSAITAGYHMNKRHWITIALHDAAEISAQRDTRGGQERSERVPDELVLDLVEQAYDLVFSSLTAATRAWVLASPNP